MPIITDSLVMAFEPFVAEHIGREWKPAFGTWRVENGALCHYFPEQPGDNVQAMIAVVPDTESFHRLASIKCQLAPAGCQRVRITMEVTLHEQDGFIVSLDESGSEWAPYFTMRPGRSDIASGSRGLDYADVPWPDDRRSHTVEVVGNEADVEFHFDGQLLYRCPRENGRPHHQLMIESFGLCAIRNVRMELEGVYPADAVPERKPLKLTAVDDFYDDLCYAKFTDPAMFDRLVGNLHDLGVSRIYWVHSLMLRPEAYGPDADPELVKRVANWNHRLGNRPGGELSGGPSLNACYPFLDKVIAAAHRRGMEVYTLHKLFDLSVLSFITNPGPDSPQVADYFCEKHPEAMLQRYTGNDGTSNQPATTIRFYKDNDRPHAIRADQVVVWVSDDNVTYRRLEPTYCVTFSQEQKAFARYWEGGLESAKRVQVITISGLSISEPYFAVVIDGQRAGSFGNRVYRLAEVLDADGKEIATTRNLLEFPRISAEPWQGRQNFVFTGLTTCRQETGNWRGADWIELYQWLDGQDLGIAFQRGTRPYVDGAPNPMHPATRKFWRDWVTSALDAGVDGIDLRIMNHNNILDWANFGFGPEVEAAFEKRYGHPFRPNADGRQKHAALLGDAYTDFLRDLSALVRGRGKKMQHHVSRPMDSQPHERPLVNIRWNWRQWMEEGLLDSITMKDLELASAFCHEVKRVARATDVETQHCPYLGVLFDASSTWSVTMKQLMRQNHATGSDGLMLYEVATFMRGNEAGQINLLYPELRHIFAMTEG